MLSKEKIADIEHQALKDFLVNQIRFSDIRDLRRKAGNAIKRLNLNCSIEEYVEYAENMLREIFEEQLKIGKAGKESK